MTKLAAAMARGMESVNWPLFVAMVAAIGGAASVVVGVYLIGGAGWALIACGGYALAFAVLLLRGLTHG